MKQKWIDQEHEEFTVTKSSGNVFADLGLPDADERLAKAQLALAITRRIRARNLNQTEAAALLGTEQDQIIQLINGKLTGFTYDRLLRFLNVLGCNVYITVEASDEENEQGQTLATIAAWSAQLYDVQTGQLLQTSAPEGASYSSIAFSHDGKTLASGGAGDSAIRWQTDL